MYSRFTPGPDGVHRRQSVEQRPVPPPDPVPEPKAMIVPPPASAPASGFRQRISDLLPGDLELGDVLVALVALLLLVDAEEDLQTILITLAAFFLL